MEILNSDENRKRGLVKYRALAIGVNDYEDSNLAPLRYAAADCNGIAAAIRGATLNHYHQDALSIVALTGTQNEPLTLGKILSKLDVLLKDVRPEDTVVFYFAGHGVLRSADPQNPEKLFLCLSTTKLDQLDQTGLLFSAVLERLKCSGAGRQILMIDVCQRSQVALPRGRQGALALPRSQSNPEAYNLESAQVSEKLSATLFDYANSHSEFYAILSCKPGQQSWEFSDLQHGSFTYFAIQGLKGKAADAQGGIGITRFFEYIHKNTAQYVEKMGQLQEPQLIMRGSQTAILGFVTLQPSVLGPLSERKKRYHDLVMVMLRQGTLDTEESRQDLQKVADTEELSDLDQIRESAVKDFQEDLGQYKKQILKKLNQQYPHPSEVFHDLRERFGLARAVAEPQEISARNAFETERSKYQNSLCSALDEKGQWLSKEAYGAVQETGKQSGFSEDVLKVLEAEVRVEFGKQIYRERFSQAIRHSLSLSPQMERELEDLFNKLSLEEEHIQVIESAESQKLLEDKANYQKEFDHAIRQGIVLSPELQSDLTILKQKLTLGDAHTHAIECKSQMALEACKAQYQKAYEESINLGDPPSHSERSRLLKLQNDLRLSDEIVDHLRSVSPSVLSRRNSPQGLPPDLPFAIAMPPIQKYKERVTKLLVDSSGKISSESREFLDRYRSALNINPSDASDIETQCQQSFLASSSKGLEFSQKTAHEQIKPPRLSIKQWMHSIRVSERQKQGFLAIGVFLSGSTLVWLSVIFYREYQERVKLSQINALMDKKDYQNCIAQAQNFPVAQALLSQCRSAQDAIYETLIDQAKNFAKQGSFQKSIDHLSKISRGSKFDNQVDRLISDSEDALLKIADEYYKKGEFIAAINILQSIRPQSQRFEAVKNSIRFFTNEWQKNEKSFEKIETSFKKKDWSQVLGESKKINHPFWKDKVSKYVEDANKALFPPPSFSNSYPFQPEPSEPIHPSSAPSAEPPYYPPPAPSYSPPAPSGQLYSPPAPSESPPNEQTPSRVDEKQY